MKSTSPLFRLASALSLASAVATPALAQKQQQAEAQTQQPVEQGHPYEAHGIVIGGTAYLVSVYIDDEHYATNVNNPIVINRETGVIVRDGVAHAPHTQGAEDALVFAKILNEIYKDGTQGRQDWEHVISSDSIDFTQEMLNDGAGSSEAAQRVAGASMNGVVSAMSVMRARTFHYDQDGYDMLRRAIEGAENQNNAEIGRQAARDMTDAGNVRRDTTGCANARRMLATNPNNQTAQRVAARRCAPPSP